MWNADTPLRLMVARSLAAEFDWEVLPGGEAAVVHAIAGEGKTLCQMTASHASDPCCAETRECRDCMLIMAATWRALKKYGLRDPKVDLVLAQLDGGLTCPNCGQIGGILATGEPCSRCGWGGGNDGSSSMGVPYISREPIVGEIAP